ncbi:hypothetical protein GUITHDRAFT_164244 [Guillardia theta CCMP2712]|uniref:Uncharacterized protein n=1 Tax=Guillardia theta (strain CCMP2712) TaxID=905079 RepID=L1J186_GUITC|nr:hypothetical protein GUITHDRAFT_164244 [Guillardia theta CCMP2712]EKX41845.1 hypothetical protein GUITHDRAFT_164244 [Guillardia theta CCMP2712]|eukprot:XP_005828825.1 hypothetical protein GUITHDRAFT_164244 [Guillardia theta CCMP2712]
MFGDLRELLLLRESGGGGGRKSSYEFIGAACPEMGSAQPLMCPLFAHRSILEEKVKDGSVGDGDDIDEGPATSFRDAVTSGAGVWGPILGGVVAVGGGLALVGTLLHDQDFDPNLACPSAVGMDSCAPGVVRTADA